MRAYVINWECLETWTMGRKARAELMATCAICIYVPDGFRPREGQTLKTNGGSYRVNGIEVGGKVLLVEPVSGGAQA